MAALRRVRPVRLVLALAFVGLLIASAAPALGPGRSAARVLLVLVALALAASWLLDLLRRRRAGRAR
jgi:membrane protease YdiL (CAAX protease family)